MKSVWGLAAMLLLPTATAWSADQQVAVYRDKPRSYMGASLVHTSIDYSGLDETLHPTAATVRMGGMAGDHVGLELRLGAGGGQVTTRNSFGNTRTKTDYSVDYLGALFFTARAPFLELPRVGTFYSQGYLGFGTEQIQTVREVCNPGCRSDTERNDETGPAFGLGLGLRARPELSLALEYTHYVSSNGVSVSGLEGVVMYHF
mgnify:CR=1 FL=1